MISVCSKRNTFDKIVFTRKIESIFKTIEEFKQINISRSNIGKGILLYGLCPIE